MITKDELEDILHALDLDYEAEASLLYVFYVRPDGLVDNFSVSISRGRSMSDREVVELMRREYPATRDASVLSVERPKKGAYKAAPPTPPAEWVDTADLCRMLHISPRTVRYWSRKGYLHPHSLGRKLYFDRGEVDALLRSNFHNEDGYADKTALAAIGGIKQQ